MKIIDRHLHKLFYLAQLVYSECVSVVHQFVKLYPLVLRIRITDRCNLHCDYCYLKGSLNRRENDELTLDEWKKIAKKLPRRTIIDITGGEPFLAENFREILQMFLERGHRVSLISNGSVYDQSLIELMVEKSLRFLMISLDGMSDYHNKSRGCQSSFEDATKLISAINVEKKKRKSKYPLICIKTNIMEDNHHELIPLSQFVFNDLGVDQLSFNLMFSNPARGGQKPLAGFDDPSFTKGNSFQYSLQERSEIIEQVKLVREWGVQTGHSINFKPDLSPPLFEKYIHNPSTLIVEKCKLYYAVTTLYASGEIIPCDLNFRHINVKNLSYDLKNYWSSEEFRFFQEQCKANRGSLAACEGCCLGKHTLRYNEK